MCCLPGDRGVGVSKKLVGPQVPLDVLYIQFGGVPDFRSLRKGMIFAGKSQRIRWEVMGQRSLISTSLELSQSSFVGRRKLPAKGIVELQIELIATNDHDSSHRNHSNYGAVSVQVHLRSRQSK